MNKLSFQKIMIVASMLFGMFFGAGNLIFPASMGQLAGQNMWTASAGFLITGVGLPLLGVAALGISRENGLLELSSRIGKKYGFFFTCTLYLTIGPFFAIPRCATVSYTVGIAQIIPSDSQTIGQAVFSLLFFGAVLFFSLRPDEIMTWIGKVLTPAFLLFLAILILRALTAPMGTIAAIEPQGHYSANAFTTGLLEGYNTMDALAGLAFGIIVVEAIRSLGVTKPAAVAKNTVYAGIFSSIFMAGIYVLVTIVGAQSRGIFAASSNGGETLAHIAQYYFGEAGVIILAVTVTIACLKTAVGLITSCGETFEKMFPKGPGYRVWAIFFCIFSFLIANLGLNTIIAYSVPVLMFLYPLAIVLILLTLFGNLFQNNKTVLQWTIGCTMIAAFFDLLRNLPEQTKAFFHLNSIIKSAVQLLPLSEQGFGWVCPAILGFCIGLVIKRINNQRT